MRKPALATALLALALGTCLLAGCGGDKQEGEGFNYSIEQTGEGGEPGKVVIEGEGGEDTTLEVSETAPTEQDLGVPIYPGAEYVPGSGQSLKTTQGESELFAIGAEFTAADGYEKVVGFYEDKLGSPNMVEETVSDWLLKDESGKIFLVSVEKADPGVKITIIKRSG